MRDLQSSFLKHILSGACLSAMLLHVEVVSVCVTDVRCAYEFTESLAVYLTGSIDDESVALFVLMACARLVCERETAAAATRLNHQDQGRPCS